MAIFTDSAGAAVSRAIQQAGLFVAWGRGDPDWDNAAVPEPVEATALKDEHGRREADVIHFCAPDPLGEIEVEGGRYTLVDEPTSFLYVAATFDKPDACGEVIREAGIFVGTELASELPAPQTYFPPSDVANGGVLLLLERFARIERNPTSPGASETDLSVRVHFVMSM